MIGKRIKHWFKPSVHYGWDVSAGTYACADCGYEMSLESATSLPPCPQYIFSRHTRHSWRVLSSQGEATGSPHPAA